MVVHSTDIISERSERERETERISRKAEHHVLGET